MSDQPTRYTLSLADGEMVENLAGQYVDYGDYAELKAQLEAGQKRDPAFLSRDYQRMWDLVRVQRGELMDAELITREEYAALAAEETNAMPPGCGSPSPRRLESYDELRAKLTQSAPCQ